MGYKYKLAPQILKEVQTNNCPNSILDYSYCFPTPARGLPRALQGGGVTKGSDTDTFLQMSFLVPATFWVFAFSPKYPRFWNFDVKFF